jgi:NAD(P)-dependent dehydrogenase (short-subunit alcohol dehydrogenase family)
MRRIFITGSSDGLGLMAAQLLVEQGHSVILHARYVQRAEASPMSTVPVRAIDNSAWIRDLVYLAFPEGEARERVPFDMVKQFSKMDPEDPESLRYKLNVVECSAMENMVRALNEAATEQAKLRGITREMAHFAST